MAKPNHPRYKPVDLMSALGAGVLGAGLGAMFATWLTTFAVAAVLIGVAVHGWGMFGGRGLGGGAACWGQWRRAVRGLGNRAVLGLLVSPGLASGFDNLSRCFAASIMGLRPNLSLNADAPHAGFAHLAGLRLACFVGVRTLNTSADIERRV